MNVNGSSNNLLQVCYRKLRDASLMNKRYGSLASHLMKNQQASVRTWTEKREFGVVYTGAHGVYSSAVDQCGVGVIVLVESTIHTSLSTAPLQESSSDSARARATRKVTALLLRALVQSPHSLLQRRRGSPQIVLKADLTPRGANVIRNRYGTHTHTHYGSLKSYRATYSDMDVQCGGGGGGGRSCEPTRELALEQTVASSWSSSGKDSVELPLAVTLGPMLS